MKYKSDYQMGKTYLKKKHQGKRTDLVSPQKREKLTITEKIAQEESVSHATIERNAKFARAVDKLVNQTLLDKRELLSGQYTKRKIKKALDYPAQKIRQNFLKIDGKRVTNIYFIQSEIGGPIKIGISDDVEKRKRDLQRYSPFKLKVIEEIKKVPQEYETKIHNLLSGHHLHHEWFKKDIYNEIPRIKKALEDKEK